MLHYPLKSVRHLLSDAFYFIMTRIHTLIILLWGAVLITTGCSRTDKLITLSGEAQGTYYIIRYYDEDNRNFQHEIDSILHDFDQTASLWVEQSTIRKVNGNTDSVISPLFADILQKSIDINRYTDGAFDCRVGKLVQAWGFSFRKQEELNQQSIDSLLTFSHGDISIDTLEDNSLMLKKSNPSTEIDFNAIAQGYSSDLIGQYLEQQGIQSYLVDIGGEVIARGLKDNGEPWTVGVERPAENKYANPEVELAVRLYNCSIVTSGSYRKYYEKDGVKYSHTIDPATGRPVQHTLLSVSVIDSMAWRADAMATAYMVMGLDKAKQFISTHSEDPETQAVLFIYSDGDNYKTYATPAFNKHIIE